MSSIAITALEGRGRQAGSGKQRGGERRRPLLSRIFLFAVVFLLLIVALDLAYQLLLVPKLIVNRVTIMADKGIGLSNEELMQIAGLQGDESYFSLDVDRITANLEAYPVIREADVTKSFPDQLSIVLRKRIPLAIAVVEMGAKSIPVVLDENGVVFEVGRSVSSYNLPVVSGVRFPEIALGMRLPDELRGYLRKLAKLRDSSPVLFGLISEVEFVKKRQADYEVLLYTTQHSLKVRLGQDIDENLLKYVLMALDVVAGEMGMENLEELDFRSGDIVYRVREE
jgi:cell division protein FtsQ